QPRLDNELQVLQSQYNPLNEESPLGLRLKKSPSLLELAQMRLNQGNADNKIQRQKRGARAPSSIDKLKASHFPATRLRIGHWEYVSKHEGDLVAKCYFSKHKLVWEVLDGGLKKKFEINWADIVALKANYAANEPGNFTIVLDKPPVFFKEVNPQPRKHTQWRSTTDFTKGEASTQRQHFLQCAPGVLDKHYEKLIQCDARLNYLSQQPDFVVNYPFFPPQTVINDQDMLGNSVFNYPEIYGISNMTSPSNLLAYSCGTVESGSLGFIHQDNSKETQSSSSGMSMDIDGQTDMNQLYTPTFQPNISLSDLVNHIENLSDQNTPGNVPFSNNAPGSDYPKEMLESISQILLSDNHLTTTSDERTIMSRVNSLCCLLQYQNSQQTVNDDSTPHQGGNDDYTPGSVTIPMPVNTTPTDSVNQMISSTAGSGTQMAPQDGNDNSTPESNRESGISRNDSFAELVHQLPRIASLPKFLFEISESGEILK
ncbi:uncharacterized protein LOC143592777, partial [Bidens hawaiensis]|uniref:uncharacterized protein LOC143592777 n=1 Tax=Bidens hawaiensis TaxID=980011 RepID=UPI00404A7E42